MADYTQIIQEINTNLPDNTTQSITAAKVRETLTDMVNAFGETDNRIYNSLSGKVDKVSNPTSGNFAGLDANGNITDSGSKASNFATAAQGAKADNAILFVEQDALTNQQRNTALANVSNQTVNSTTGKMGYKVLDPTKTFAEQVTSENTIYEIRDVFDLGGTQVTPVSVTMPAGSTLKFNGGVIKNCTLVNAYVDAAREKIFDTSVDFTNLKNGVVYPEWWGAIADGTTDNSSSVQKALSISKTVSFGRGTYVCNTALQCSSAASIVGENKQASIIKTNGIKININSSVNNIKIKSISKTTPYLLKISNDIFGLDETDAKIVIDDIILQGETYNDWDSEIQGLILECHTTANTPGFCNVFVNNVYFTGRMLYGIYFNAIDTNAWITFCYFNNISIGNAKHPIEFESVRNDGNFYNFQMINFKNVYAQCNYNSGNQWTDSFAKIMSLSQGVFDSCCLVDGGTNYVYYFKSDYSSISVFQQGERPLTNCFSNYNNDSNENIISRNVLFCNSTASRYTPILATKFNSTTGSEATSPQLSIIKPCYILNNKNFIGFAATNNYEFTNTKQNYLFGINRIDGHIVHSMAGASEEYKINSVYSTGYIPAYSSTLPGINDLGGLARGAFIYWTPFGHLLCFDTYTGSWNDALGVRITNNVTKRKGTTAERTAITMYSYNNGFLFYDKDLKKYVLWNGSAWTNVDGSTLAPTKGADTDRPTLTSSDAGFQYFDTTLGKYICWNGTAWVNLDGTALS